MKNHASPLKPTEGIIPPPTRCAHRSSLRSALLAALTLTAASLIASAESGQAQVIVNWTFETSIPTSAGPFAPEVNNTTMGTATPAATTNTPSGSFAGAITSPAGNGSPHSFSSNGWNQGEYFQFTLSTTGITGPLGISYDQTGSATGPRDFAVSYSTDGGTTFTQLAGSAYQLTAISFSTTTPNPAATHSFDFTNVADLGNINSLVFRIIDQDTTAINGATVATAGTDRIDNFIVQSVPEPTTVLGGALLVGATAWSQRRRLRGLLAA